MIIYMNFNHFKMKVGIWPNHQSTETEDTNKINGIE